MSAMNAYRESSPGHPIDESVLFGVVDGAVERLIWTYVATVNDVYGCDLLDGARKLPVDKDASW